MKKQLHYLFTLVMMLVAMTAQAQGEKWTVDFGSGAFPTGTTVDGSFYFSGSSGYTVGTVNIYSPKLDIKEGETLLLNARSSSYYSTPTLKVYYSSDKSNWTLHRDFGNLLSTSALDCIADELPTGVQYLRVECSSIYLYKLEGPTRYFADNDVEIALQAPETGMVNNKMQISAAVTNAGLSRQAGEYTIELLIDDNVVATASEEDFASNATRDITFDYTPHAEGIVTAAVRYTCGDYVVNSTAANIDVKAEVASAESQVGTATGNDMCIPFNFMYKKTHAETIYSAADLKLKNGTKITKIGFHGYNTSEKTVPVKIWVANTDASTLTTSFANTEEMTLVYDATATFKKVGKYQNYQYTYDDLVEFEFTEPFVYTGGNIHFVYEKQENDNGGTRYEASTALKATSPSAYTGANYTLPTTMTVNSATPVLYLSTANDPATISGTITNKKNGNPVEGVAVTLISDEVMYSGTTDSEGNYAIEVIQTDREYQLTAEKEGFFPATATVSLADGNIVKDFELIESKDLFIVETEIPAQAVVNNEYTAHVKIQNVNPTTFAAADYTVKMMMGNEVVEVETIDIPAGETVELVATTTVAPIADAPEGANAAPVLAVAPTYFEVAFGEEELTSETIDVEIMAEEITQDVAAGEANSEKETTPVRLWYKASQSETIYPAALLTDIKEGSRITALTYKGRSAEDRSLNATVQVWMENVTDGTLPAEMTDVENLKQFYNGTFALEPQEAQTLTLTLDEPFTYEGGDIRIIVRHTADDECKTYFNSDQRYESLYRYGNTADEMLNSTALTTEMPVCYLTVDNAAHLYGTIDDCYGNTVEGAVITLQSGAVRYEATTDASGNYDVAVGRKELTYDVTITNPLNDDVYTDEVMFENGDVELSLTIYVDPTYTAEQLTTVCLPVALTSAEALEAGTFYELYFVSDNEINFLRVESTEEGKPYMFVPASEKPFNGLVEAAEGKEAGYDEVDGVSFIGTFEDIDISQTDNGQSNCTFDSDSQTFIEGTSLKPFQAYISKPALAPSAIVLWEEPTAINNIDATDQSATEKTVFTIDGRRVARAKVRGIYVEKGKVVVKR